MRWEDVAGALNRLEEPVVVRDIWRAARRFGTVGYSTQEDLPTAEVEHDTAMWAHGVPPELIGRAGEIHVPGDVAYRHVVGPVHPYFHFPPGPIGGGS